MGYFGFFIFYRGSIYSPLHKVNKKEERLQPLICSVSLNLLFLRFKRLKIQYPQANDVSALG